MSLKPPKKSDLDKSWMKARLDRPKKIQPEYHLIITEGTDTETAYFGAIKKIINSVYSELFGQTNALSYGFCFISVLFIPIFTETPIGQN